MNFKIVHKHQLTGNFASQKNNLRANFIKPMLTKTITQLNLTCVTAIELMPKKKITSL